MIAISCTRIPRADISRITKIRMPALPTSEAPSAICADITPTGVFGLAYVECPCRAGTDPLSPCGKEGTLRRSRTRSEEHTSDLLTNAQLVCRLLLEQKPYSTTPQQ